MVRKPWGQSLRTNVGVKLAEAGVRVLNPRFVGVTLIKRMAESLHKRYTARDLELDLSSVVEGVECDPDAQELKKALVQEGLEAGEVFKTLFPG